MPDKLAKALAIYLKQARPHTNSRALFVQHKHYVGRPLSTRSVRDLISRAFERCGIAARGAHILRHTWATYAHRRGASLKLIADILGHSSLQTTLRYAHVNLDELRQAALPWPKIGK
jgi:site-specific recombinase XerD